jgi:hypothetical protein
VPDADPVGTWVRLHEVEGRRATVIDLHLLINLAAYDRKWPARFASWRNLIFDLRVMRCRYLHMQ